MENRLFPKQMTSITIIIESVQIIDAIDYRWNLLAIEIVHKIDRNA